MSCDRALPCVDITVILSFAKVDGLGSVLCWSTSRPASLLEALGHHSTNLFGCVEKVSSLFTCLQPEGMNGSSSLLVEGI